jgi:hypothetical protein
MAFFEIESAAGETVYPWDASAEAEQSDLLRFVEENVPASNLSREELERVVLHAAERAARAEPELWWFAFRAASVAKVCFLVRKREVEDWVAAFGEENRELIDTLSEGVWALLEENQLAMDARTERSESQSDLLVARENALLEDYPWKLRQRVVAALAADA